MTGYFGQNQPAVELYREKQRAETAEAELKRWHLLHAWGGTPEIVDAFIKGQQTRIHEAQGVEEALINAEARAKELELKLVRQDEVDREAYESAVCMELEDRVAELEAQIAEVVGSQRNEDKSLPTWAQVMNRVALLAEQNARLREQVAELIAKELSNPVLRQIDNALAAAKPGEVVHLPGGSYFFGFTGKAHSGEEAST